MKPLLPLGGTPPIRQWLVLGLLLLQGVALIVLTASLRVNMEALQFSNAQEVMQHVSENVLSKTKSYLAPAEQTVHELDRFMRQNLIAPETASFERDLLEQLVTNPQITGVYFGNARGEFTFAKRNPTGFTLKRIRYQAGKRSVSFQDFDRGLTLVASRVDAKDTYDPRTRPWYREAMQRHELIWTGPYVFFTSQQPGITTAMPTYAASAKVAGVIGVDIEISALSDFIGTIPTSPHGTSFIVTGTGEVVGMTGLKDKLKPDSKTLPKLADVGSPTAIALEKFGVTDTSFHRFEEENITWVGMIRPLLVNRDANWWLGIHAPQADFVGSTQALFNRQLIQTIIISLVVALLAIPLIWTVSSPLEVWYRRATTDELTSLLNRTEFLRRGEGLLRTQPGSSVLVVLDLDGFKSVNDLFGHSAGDTVLRTITGRLQATIRKQDLAARFGGDEFALLLPGLDATTAQQRFETWRQEIVTPYRSNISVSAGLIELRPGDSLKESLHLADMALLKAKSQGKDQTVYHSSPRPVTT